MQSTEQRDQNDAEVRGALWNTVMNAIIGTHSAGSITDAIISAFEVRPRGTVTDAEVEAAARAYAGDEMSAEEWEWVKTQPEVVGPYLTGMRAALEAAREARA